MVSDGEIPPVSDDIINTINTMHTEMGLEVRLLRPCSVELVNIEPHIIHLMLTPTTSYLSPRE